MRVRGLAAGLAIAVATSCSAHATEESLDSPAERAAARGDEPATSTTSTTIAASTAPPTTTPSATVRPPLGLASLAELPSKRPSVIVTPTGVVLPVLAVEDDGRLRVRTVCGIESHYAGPGRRYDRVHVVLDPGHGGSDPGAVQNGIRESDVNLDVAQRARAHLEREGLDVVLTREFDYYVPFVVRGELALNSAAKLLISIHHNSGGASLASDPGTEVFYQQLDENSRRLAGLLWEDVTNSLRVHPIQWYSAAGAGAMFREGRTGPDFYGVLRRTTGVPAALLEIAYLSNPREAALVATDAFREDSAVAIARAVTRYFTTDDPGAGFSAPRSAGPPTTPTGGTSGCVEPPYE
ncbi:MAG TPA: N-acetylmuramoyl-L-alanine amidase [Acidimicrobiales bacterium]|nr:N-acetylmuramoyl-L-alanine amidase [Acidimicrobiales bacterium]